MVDLNLYRVFYTVAKCGSLSKAADELFVSQSAVSYAIRQLENQLGGPLFNRVSRGMELSDTGGKQMFEIVEHVLDILKNAEKNFSELKNIADGTIRISASNNMITHYIMKYIIEYHEAYPNVVLTFTDSSTRQSLDLIKAGKADIAFVNLPIEDDGVLFTGQTGEIHDVFAASNKFSNLFGRKINLAALSNYPLLMLDKSTTSRQEIDKFANSLNINLVPEFELMSVELMVEMAKKGLGIACVPYEYIRDEIANGELKVLEITPEFPVRATGVVVNKDRNYSFAVELFLKLLNKYEDKKE